MCDYQNVSEDIIDPVNENLKQLAALFPAAVKDGQLDVEALKEELGQFEEVDNEKYELDWPGKQAAKQKVFEKPAGRTLKFVSEDSKHAETTENIFIEGDNLEVLQLLRKNYYGAIKMIYIDPPYNTGNDFVYKDDFGMKKQMIDIVEGRISNQGERYTINNKGQNKYHANWLNMMLPRLKVARDLLKDDGVIFISIDENEAFNLRTVCNEVFGDSNFMSEIVIKVRHENRILKADKDFHETYEYCLIYRKSDAYKQPKRIEDNSSIDNYIYSIDIIAPPIDLIECDGKLIEVYSPACYKLFKHKVPSIDFFQKISIRGSLKEGNSSGRFFMKHLDKIKDKFAYLYKVPNMGNDKYDYRYFMRPPTNGHANGIYFQGVPKDKKNTKEVPYPNFYDFVNEFNNVGYEGGIEFRSGKKPLGFLKQLFKLSGVNDCKDCTILDFFSGSASTAEACVRANLADCGNRKFIMVQLPEDLDISLLEAKGTYKSVLVKTIAILDEIEKPHKLSEIGKERIRRAGEKIKADNADKEGIENLDIGFKVFKVGDTNINWLKKDLAGNGLDEFVYANNSNKDKLDFAPGFTDLDVVYEIMLRQSDVPLSASIEKLDKIGKRTYLFADSYLVCLEEQITQKLVNDLAEIEPLPIKFVFRDSAFGDDIALKDKTFRTLSALIDRNTGGDKQTYTVEFI